MNCDGNVNNRMEDEGEGWVEREEESRQEGRIISFCFELMGLACIAKDTPDFDPLV